MITLISIHAIGASDPDADLIFTGKFKANGDPIVKKSTITIPPASFFEIGEVEAENLISVGAARYPTAVELELGKVQQSTREPFHEGKTEEIQS